MLKTTYQQAYRDARLTSAFKAETLALQFVSAVWKLMEEKGLSQVELAAKLEKKASFVSRMLSGPHNLTLKTIAEFAAALEADVQLDLGTSVSIDEIVEEKLNSYFSKVSVPAPRFTVDKSANEFEFVFPDAITQANQLLAA